MVANKKEKENEWKKKMKKRKNIAPSIVFKEKKIRFSK